MDNAFVKWLVYSVAAVVILLTLGTVFPTMLPAWQVGITVVSAVLVELLATVFTGESPAESEPYLRWLTFTVATLLILWALGMVPNLLPVWQAILSVVAASVVVEVLIALAQNKAKSNLYARWLAFGVTAIVVPWLMGGLFPTLLPVWQAIIALLVAEFVADVVVFPVLPETA